MAATDVVLLGLLGLGFVVGFFRGFIRALLALGAWAVCFVGATYLRLAIGDWLAGAASLNPFKADMIAFGVIFFIFFSALLVVIVFSRTPTALTGHALLDDVFGGIVGVIVVVLVVAGVSVMFASYYRIENPPVGVDIGPLAELHRALLGSTVASFIGGPIVHLMAFLLGPVLPAELLVVMA
jgi:uncharacterized membrane protein required for colicin V production